MISAVDFKSDLESLQKNNLIRNLTPVQSRNGNEYTISGKKLLNFSSNDYLGLAQNQAISDVLIENIKVYGIGSGSSALISGYYSVQTELEEQFAEYLGQEQALLFNSGYHANVGVISSLVKRGNIVFSDKFCHASILDGIQLSRAKHFRYQHNNLRHLSELSRSGYPDFIITERIFSMEGDVAPLDDIAKSFETNLIIDDAHGLGILDRITAKNLCLINPLGKAFASMGAIVSGKSTIIATIRQFAKSYKYTTALPPAFIAALIKTLELVKTESWRREKLFKNIACFYKQAELSGLELLNKAETPIMLVPIKDNFKLMQIHYSLKKQGFWIAAIREPTIPKGSARLRISLNALHTAEQIKNLTKVIAYEIKNC
jgi:8-amino-7-oxononanoate synthase